MLEKFYSWQDPQWHLALLCLGTVWYLACSTHGTRLGKKGSQEHLLLLQFHHLSMQLVNNSH